MIIDINEIKQALLEVREICGSHIYCRECPFSKNDGLFCRLCRMSSPFTFLPQEWDVDDWKE